MFRRTRLSAFICGFKIHAFKYWYTRLTETALQITIATASDAERDWCAELMARSEPWITLGATLEERRAACRSPERVLWVARAGAEPCGFVLVHPRGVAGSPYIASIGVAEQYRGQGIGSRLLEHAEQSCGAAARYIFLCVSSFNGRARRLYERRGYTALGELKDYVMEGASEILMHKRLVRS